MILVTYQDDMTGVNGSSFPNVRCLLLFCRKVGNLKMEKFRQVFCNVF